MPSPEQIEQALATVRRLSGATPGHLDKPLALLGGGFWHGASCDRYTGDLTAARRTLRITLRDAEQQLLALQHAAAAKRP